MSSEAQLAVDVWDAVRDILPAAKRADAAVRIIRALSEYGFEAADLSDIEDEDAELAEAFETVFGEGHYPDDDDDEEYE